MLLPELREYMNRSFQIKTSARNQFVDITGRVRDVIAESGVVEGLCCVYVPHTTAAVTINENADPTVPADILKRLEILSPLAGDYRHSEGNSDAHIKAVLVGSSVNISVTGGQADLGTWQGVFFCEFDGPRKRTVSVKIISCC